MASPQLDTYNLTPDPGENRRISKIQSPVMVSVRFENCDLTISVSSFLRFE